MDRADGRPVQPKPFEEQARYSRTMLLPPWFERAVALGFNAHAFHHLFPHVPYYAHPPDVAYGEVNEWKDFIRRAKAQRATVLLYGAPS
jgi:fatty acid desaturase